MSSAGSTQPAPLSAADHKRFEELFQKLDKNRDGKIEARELAESLKALHGITDVDKHAQVRNLKCASHVSLLRAICQSGKFANCAVQSRNRSCAV